MGFIKKSVICLSFVVLAGCSNTSKVSNSWLHQDVFNRDLSGTLVVTITDRDKLKVMFEDAYVNELKKYNINAHASHDIDKKFVKAKDIIAYANQHKLDTVLVLNYAGVNQQERYNPGTVYYGIAPGYGDFDGYYGYIYEFSSSPSFYTMHQDVSLVSTLYQVSNKEMLWTATSSQLQGSKVAITIDSYIASFVKQLQKDKLLK